MHLMTSVKSNNYTYCIYKRSMLPNFEHPQDE